MFQDKFETETSIWQGISVLVLGLHILFLTDVDFVKYLQNIHSSFKFSGQNNAYYYKQLYNTNTRLFFEQTSKLYNKNSPLARQF